MTTLYTNCEPITENTYTPSLQDLLDSYDISVRAFNVCTFCGLKTVADLYNYISVHHRLDRIPNCGRKTEKELKEIVIKYSSHSTRITGNYTLNAALR